MPDDFGLSSTDTSLVASLRGPISRAAPTSCVAAPGPVAGVARQPSRTRRVFVVDRHRRANRARSSDMPAKLHQIGMRHNAVVYVHREIVGRIAASALCNKNEIPG